MRAMIVERAYKYRFCPTEDQKRQLAQTFGCARHVYNWGLETRTQAWRQEQKSLSYEDTCAMLTTVSPENLIPP